MPQTALIPKLDLDSTQLSYIAASTAVALALGIVIRLLYTSVSRDPRTKRRRKGKMDVIVKWGKERLHVPLPPLDTPLSVFRNTLADHTGLPPDSFKIIFAGAVLKDNSAPLSAFRLKPGSTLAVIGSGQPLPPGVTPEKQKPTEESTIASIRSEVSAMESTLSPEVTSFLEQLDADSQQPSLGTTHTRLGELILQVLLRLDAMSVEGWEEARKERRAAVKQAQDMLQRLDDGWKKSMGSGP